MSDLDASIVIPVRGRVAEVDRLLSCLTEEQIGNSFEVLLIENHFKPQRPNMEYYRKHLSLRQIVQATGNQAACRNAGALAAEGNNLLFLDSDIYFGQGELKKLITESRASPKAIRMCNVQFPPGAVSLGSQLHDVPRFIANFADVQNRRELHFKEFVSCSFFMARDTYISVDGFDDTSAGYGYEDVEFSWRADLAGLPIRLLTDGAVWHHKVYTPQAVFDRAKALGEAAVWLVSRQPTIESVLPLGIADYKSGKFVCSSSDLERVPNLLSQIGDLERRFERAPEAAVRALAEEAYLDLNRIGRYLGIAKALNRMGGTANER